ncbi:MAG: IS21 family transposase [Comamonadaceae bacterium CG12_big_fil_rev_8_21_14_0_65_59_15]|nr:MAG: integrase [Comamonadaceae bacterium CG2_30_59_20]PIQ51671.1 MAG: IS21 family transposase [Comamonadaceae bacterium CG12_big_fil_rev_8_21_14_0_65_59_15]
MPDTRRITMRFIKDILRLKLEQHHSHQHIASALGISKGVVTKYVKLAAKAGLQWPQVQAMDETALHAHLMGTPRRASTFVAPDYGHLHQELRRKGMTLMLLWQEHSEAHPDESVHSYSQFCENYRRFAKTLKHSMRQSHRAGEKLFIDYAGPTVGLTDGSRAHIFVSALGASGYTFAYATAHETTADWLGATAQALRFYGGCTELIVPDNPKAMIVDPDRYEPRANDTVLDFARHYGTSVLPARPRHPQDKAKAESAVQVVERWILMRLRHQKFETIDEVNQAIAPLLAQLNNKPFQKLVGCRASVFADIDAPALRPLPMQTWEWAVFKTVKVHIDQHIEFEGHRYSVPHALVGVTLEVRVTQHTLEVLHRGQRVASHARCAHKGGFTTVPEHLSAAHRAHLEWTPERLIHWGQDIGVATGRLVTRILESRKHPEHGYRACLALLSLAKRFGKPRLEAASLIALELGTTRSADVREILINGRDQVSPNTAGEWVSPAHANVRGPAHYH